MAKEIHTTIDRFEGEFAVLKHKDNEILWPREDLPSDTFEGSIITLTATNETQMEQTRTERAKTILNDILNESLGAPGTPPATLEEHETVGENRLEQIDKDLKKIDEDLRKNG